MIASQKAKMEVEIAAVFPLGRTIGAEQDSVLPSWKVVPERNPGKCQEHIAERQRVVAAAPQRTLAA